MKAKTIFFRCGPDTDLKDLRKIKNKNNLVLWSHGGKFTPDETAYLAKIGAETGLPVALDLGQKTRVEEIYKAELLGKDGLGKEIKVGERVVFVERKFFETQLYKILEAGPEHFVKVNRLPDIGKESGINFSEEEVVCRLDRRLSSPGNFLVGTIESTTVGRIYADHSLSGRKFSLEENRMSLLNHRDMACLERVDQNNVKYLIVSFVLDKEGVLEALKTVEQKWPGWLKKGGHKLMLKIETVKAVQNLGELMTIPEVDFMLGLGDLRMATSYVGWNFESTVTRILELLNESNKSVVVASGIGVDMVLRANRHVIDSLLNEKIVWLNKIFKKYNSVRAIGTTSESIKAGNYDLLDNFISKFREGINAATRS